MTYKNKKKWFFKFKGTAKFDFANVDLVLVTCSFTESLHYLCRRYMCVDIPLVFVKKFILFEIMFSPKVIRVSPVIKKSYVCVISEKNHEKN